MRIIYLLVLFILASCSVNKIVKHHGVNALEIKNKKLIINETNKNQLIKILGPPSTKSFFDENIFIYIERKTTSTKLIKLGKKEILTNNVLLAKFDDRGILINKEFFNKNDLNNLKISDKITENEIGKSSFLDSALNSMREKINDPLGKKRGSLNK